MEYVYAAMLLHKAGQKVDEGSLKKVLEAAGVKADEAKVKALVAALDGVDIEKVIEETSIAAGPAPAAPAADAGDKKEEPKEEKKEEDTASAAEGLGALFG
jgi:large subunit ribosomal protein L12